MPGLVVRRDSRAVQAVTRQIVIWRLSDGSFWKQKRFRHCSFTVISSGLLSNCRVSYCKTGCRGVKGNQALDVARIWFHPVPRTLQLFQ